jgi:hypothetical protein
MRGERSPARGGSVISRVRRASEVSHFAQTFRLTKTQTGIHGVPPRLCWGAVVSSIRHRKAFGLFFKLLNRDPPGCPWLAPKHVERKEIPCKLLQLCKEIR